MKHHQRNPLDRFLIGLVAVLVLLGAVTSILPIGNRSRTPSGVTSTRSVLEHADVKTVQAVQRMELKLDRLATSQHADTRFVRASQRIATELSSGDSTRKLVMAMAADLMHGGHQASGHIQKVVQRHLSPVSAGYARDVHDILQEFENELAAIRGTATTQLKGPLADQGISADAWDTALKRLVISTALTGVLLPADIVLLVRSTLLKRIQAMILMTGKRFFGSAAAKAGSAPLAALVDGPLPIGDVIAGIGLAWSAFEINAARTRFRNDIEAQVQQQAMEMRIQVHQRAKELAMECLSRHQEIQGQLAHAVQGLTQPSPKIPVTP